MSIRPPFPTAEVTALQTLAHSLGVRFTLSGPWRTDPPDAPWYFGSFARTGAGRCYSTGAACPERAPETKGNGARILRAICELADAHGATLRWTAYPHTVAYYEQFGARIVKRADSDRWSMHVMQREPHAKPVVRRARKARVAQLEATL